MIRWLITTVLALALAAPVSAKEEFGVGYVCVIDDAQAMLAHEAGLYEKYGLDAKLIEFSSGTDLIKGIVGVQLDIGVLGFSNAFTWVSRGADLKIVGGAQRGYHSPVVRNDSGVNKVENLNGRNLASQNRAAQPISCSRA